MLLVAARRAAETHDVFVLRDAGLLSLLVYFWVRRFRKPFAVEVVSDPAEIMRTIDHPLRALWGVLFRSALRRECQSAVAVSYVTRAVLQRAYPPGAGTEAFVVNDVRLGDEQYTPPRQHTVVPRPLQLLHVGNMNQIYKGHAELLRALVALTRAGLDCQLTLVGDGTNRLRFEELATHLGLGDRARFRGNVAWGAPLFRLMDEAHLFVFPSYTEGSPKALIEAMARGLPAVATRVGGIPELLADEDLVRPRDVQALVAKISEVCAHPDRLTAMSERNHRTALEYHERSVAPQRQLFYRRIRTYVEGPPNDGVAVRCD